MNTEGRYFNPLTDYWNKKISTISSELGHMSDEERFKYQSSLDMYRTNVAVMKNERAEGIEEGLTKGRAEGRAEGQHIMQIQIAQSMKQMGMSAEQVSQATGLTMEEINAM